jgi:mono/diheme cytochrome c family protein
MKVFLPILLASKMPAGAFLLCVVSVLGCGDSGDGSATSGSKDGAVAPRNEFGVTDPVVLRRALASSPLPAPPADSTNRYADDPEAAELGRMIFFDPRLSGNGEVSCATCHQPDRWFADGLTKSKGIGIADRHSPTLVDAAHHRWFNWDGRSDSMWGHTIRPIENPLEMGGDRTMVARLLLEDPDLNGRYEAIFGAIPLVAADLPRRARPIGDLPSVEAWERLSPLSSERFEGAPRGSTDGPSRFRSGVMADRCWTPPRFEGWRCSSARRNAGNATVARSSATENSTTSEFQLRKVFLEIPGDLTVRFSSKKISSMQRVDTAMTRKVVRRSSVAA